MEERELIDKLVVKLLERIEADFNRLGHKTARTTTQGDTLPIYSGDHDGFGALEITIGDKWYGLAILLDGSTEVIDEDHNVLIHSEDTNAATLLTNFHTG